LIQKGLHKELFEELKLQVKNIKTQSDLEGEELIKLKRYYEKIYSQSTPDTNRFYYTYCYRFSFCCKRAG
jgi:hypothetical protein